jgi:hypothetical protein
VHAVWKPQKPPQSHFLQFMPSLPTDGHCTRSSGHLSDARVGFESAATLRRCGNPRNAAAGRRSWKACRPIRISRWHTVPRQPRALAVNPTHKCCRCVGSTRPVTRTACKNCMFHLLVPAGLLLLTCLRSAKVVNFLCLRCFSRGLLHAYAERARARAVSRRSHAPQLPLLPHPAAPRTRLPPLRSTSDTLSVRRPGKRVAGRRVALRCVFTPFAPTSSRPLCRESFRKPYPNRTPLRGAGRDFPRTCTDPVTAYERACGLGARRRARRYGGAWVRASCPCTRRWGCSYPELSRQPTRPTSPSPPCVATRAPLSGRVAAFGHREADLCGEEVVRLVCGDDRGRGDANPRRLLRHLVRALPCSPSASLAASTLTLPTRVAPYPVAPPSTPPQ